MRCLRNLAVGLLTTAALVAAPTSATAAPPPDFVGIVSDDAFIGSPEYRDAAFARQQAMGINLVRRTFEWMHIEYVRGSYDFYHYDPFVGAAARHGIRVLPVLFHPPKFHSSQPKRRAVRGTYFPKRYAELGNFGAAVAKRYGVNGSFWTENPDIPKVPILSYQVWNEPNLTAYNPPKPSPKRYVKLLKAAAKGIRAVEPNAEIVTAGLPDSRQSRPGNVYKFIAAMYRAGARGAFDTLAINPYGRNAKAVMAKLNRVRKIMRRYRDSGSSLWATEIGWSDSGPRSDFKAGAKGQARNITKTIAAMKKQRSRLKLRGFVYYSWTDGRVYSKAVGDFWGLHTGLLRLNGKPKPALKAFGKAVARL
jgi:polysaccharide biosynthesis protein PslG